MECGAIPDDPLPVTPKLEEPCNWGEKFPIEIGGKPLLIHLNPHVLGYQLLAHSISSSFWKRDGPAIVTFAKSALHVRKDVLSCNIILACLSVNRQLNKAHLYLTKKRFDNNQQFMNNQYCRCHTVRWESKPPSRS